MKNIYLLTFLLCSSFLIGQNGIIVPPQNVSDAFEKQYPQKKPTWSIEYGATDNDVRFEAKFNASGKTKGYAMYDQYAVFKSYKEQIPGSKLPKNAQLYLDTNFPVKSVSKSKAKSKTKAKPIPVVREVFSVVDAKSKISYQVKVKKESKNCIAIFDAEGNFIKTVQID